MRVIHRLPDCLFRDRVVSRHREFMGNFPNGLHGAYTRAELNRTIGRTAVSAALSCGGLWRFSREVLIDGRRAAEWRCRAAAALLYAGPSSALCGHTALAVHGIDVAETAPIHLLVPYRRKLRSRPSVRVHNGPFDEIDLVERVGLRVVSLEHGLAEVLCRGTRRMAIACLDQALALCRGSGPDALRVRVARQVQARPDPRGLRQAVEMLELATGLAESPAESWTLLRLVDGGLPVPEQQYRIVGLDGREIYRLDFAWPELRVAVEYDGYEAHEQRKLRDAAKDEDLRRRGWLVIRSDVADLKDPARLVAAVKAAFSARGLDLAAA